MPSYYVGPAPFTLPGEGVGALDAVTKGYVDALVAAARSTKVTVTGQSLGAAQAAGQTGFTWYQVTGVARRGLASLFDVTAANSSAVFDVEVRGAAISGSLWLQAVGATGRYRNPSPWYFENDAATVDTLHLGIKNTGTVSSAFTLTGLRMERFA